MVKVLLVTGSCGFIGTHLVERLLRSNANVRALCRTGHMAHWSAGNAELVQADILDEIAMKQAAEGVDTVFHLGAKVHENSESLEDEEAYFEVNVKGTRNLLRGALAGGARRFVFFSSVKAMGETTEVCTDETARPKPLTPYGRSKLEAERIVLEFGREHGLHVSCVRLPLVYGTGHKGNLFRMIAAIDRGFFPPLPEFGNRRSMVHVANVVEAAMLAATNPVASGQCYIVTDARPYSTRELYELIAKALGKSIPRWHVPAGAIQVAARVGDLIGHVTGRRWIIDSDSLAKLTESAWYSSDKLTRELGYKPTITFEQALPELIDWYRKSKA